MADQAVDVTKILFDTGDAERAIRRLNNILKQHNAAVDGLVKATARYNSEGKAVDLTFKAISQSGEQVTGKLKRQGAVWHNLGTSVSGAVKKLKEAQVTLAQIQKLVGISASSFGATVGGGAHLTGPIAAGLQNNVTTFQSVIQQQLLAQANKSAAGHAGPRFDSDATVSQILKRHKDFGRDIATQFGVAGKAKDKFKDNLEKLDTTGTKAFHNLTISWRSFLRFFVVHEIYRGLNAIIAALGQAIHDAAEFEIRISEIRTLSQENQLGFEKWANSIIKVSNEFGKPILDATRAAYDAISNQVTRGAETFDFLRQVIEFSNVAVSSATDAINLLSSGLNAFELNSADVTRVAAVMFKTIDLGRVTADEMSSTIGRILPLANDLGITMEEVSAAIATITIQGVNAHETFTFLTQVFNKLIKPTKEMKEFLGELGFESGEAAIATLGFSGVLQALNVEAQKGTARIVQLFDEVRGLKGVVALTGGAFNTFESNLAKIRSSLTSYQAAVDIAAESTGRKFVIELNKTKNFFLELGRTILDVIDKIITPLGGLANIVEIVTNVVLLGAAAVVTYYTTLITATTAIVSFEVAMAAGTAPIALFTGAVTLATVAVNRLALAITAHPIGALALAVTAVATAFIAFHESSEDVERKLEELSSKTIEQLEKTQKELKRRREIAYDETSKAWEDALNDQYRAFLRFAANIKIESNAIVGNLRRGMAFANQRIEDVLDVTVANIERSIDDLEARIKSAQNESENAAERLAERENADAAEPFETRINDAKSIFSKLNIIKEFVEDMSSRGDWFLDTGNFEAAVDLQEKITKSLVEGREAAKAAIEENLELIGKSRDEEAKLQEELTEKQREFVEANSPEQQRKAFEAAVEINKKITTLLEARSIAQQEINLLTRSQAEFEEKIVESKESQNTLDEEILEREEVKRQDAQEALEAQKEAFENFKKTIQLLDTFDKDFKSDPAKLAQFDELTNRLLGQAGAAGLDQNQQLALFREFNQKRVILVQQIEAEISDIRIGEIQKQIQEEKVLREKAAKEALDKSKEFETKAETKANEAEALITKLDAYVQRFSGERFGPDAKAQPKFEKAERTVQAIRGALLDLQANASAANLKKFFDAIFAAQNIITQLNEEDRSGARRNLAKAGVTGALNELILAGKSLQDISISFQQAQDALANQQAILQGINQALDLIPEQFREATDFGTEFGDAGARSVDQVVDEVRELVNELINAKQLMDALAQDAQDLADEAAEAGVPIPNRFGGSYFARGGFGPRGMDRIPAFLSRGESVIDARNSMRFFPQISAMRAGYNPLGGNSTTTVGDINIHLNGSSSDTLTANRIGRSLQRALRQGILRTF